MKDKTIRFGILGCGFISRFHADAIHSLENAELIGAADVNIAFAETFAQTYGIKAYSDFADMLADAQIDAVCICTASGFHYENAMQALQAGKHVVIEKPMAFTEAEAMRLKTAAEENNRMLTVISQLRFSDDIHKVKALMEENAFGKLVLCDLYMKYWRDPAYYTDSTWKGTLRFDGGGALMNQGIHGVDLLLYLAGNAKVICAKNQTRFHDIEVEDASVAMLEFENGAMGVIEATTCSNPGFPRRIEIIGTKGSVVLVEHRIEKLILDGKTITCAADEPLPGTASAPGAMSWHLHALLLSNFIAAIEGKEKLFIPAEEGSRAVALIEQIYRYR